MTAFGYVFVTAAFLWLVGATVLSVERRKFFGLAALAFLVGLMTGWLMMWGYIPELGLLLGDRMQSIKDDQWLATTVSYGALYSGEKGNETGAKSLLATQIVGYYRDLKNAQRLSPEQKKFLDTPRRSDCQIRGSQKENPRASVALT